MDNNNEQLSFNDLSTRELKSIVDILKTTNTFEEFLIQFRLIRIQRFTKTRYFSIIGFRRTK